MDEMWQLCTQCDVTSKQMLENCVTVEEAISFYLNHYESNFEYAHIIITDRCGVSAAITWYWNKMEMRVTHKSDTFQVIGN